MDQQDAVDRLQRAFGLTDAEMELARSLPSTHWADMRRPLEDELAARVARRIPVAEALTTAIGHAEGWLPGHLAICYDRTRTVISPRGDDRG